MRILALDTCLAACSVAVWEDGVVRAREWAPMQRGHAEALLPMLEKVRLKAGFEYADFDRLAVSVGPGSFAGVRVGLSAARGICAARNLPLVGVNTLELLAAGVATQERLGMVLDARNDQVYFQAFEGGAVLCPPSLLPLSEAVSRIHELGGISRLAGSGAVALAALCGNRVAASDWDVLPDAAILAAMAANRMAVAGEQVIPLYLRAPDAKLPAAQA